MNLRLTRRANSYYLLTLGPVAVCAMGKSGYDEAFPKPGDPLQMPYVCQNFVDQIIPEHRDLEPRDSARIALLGLSYDHPEESARRIASKLPETFRGPLIAALTNEKPVTAADYCTQCDCPMPNDCPLRSNQPTTD